MLFFARRFHPGALTYLGETWEAWPAEFGTDMAAQFRCIPLRAWSKTRRLALVLAGAPGRGGAGDEAPVLALMVEILCVSLFTLFSPSACLSVSPPLPTAKERRRTGIERRATSLVEVLRANPQPIFVDRVPYRPSRNPFISITKVASHLVILSRYGAFGPGQQPQHRTATLQPRDPRCSNAVYVPKHRPLCPVLRLLSFMSSKDNSSARLC
jgi:hypothetical protein